MEKHENSLKNRTDKPGRNAKGVVLDLRCAETRTRRRSESDQFRRGMAEAAVLREAENTIKAATGVDISQWMPDELDWRWKQSETLV